MEIPVTDQNLVKEAIEKGNVNEKDLTTTIKASIKDLLPEALQGQVTIEPNSVLLDYYMAVEKSILPVPWINTSKAVFLELPANVITSNKTVNKERVKFRKATGLPDSEFEEVIHACRTQVTYYEAKAKSMGGLYKQAVPFVFCLLQEEDRNVGARLTPIDGRADYIYSNCCDMPFNKSQRQQNVFYKTVVSLLLKEMKLTEFTTRIEFAFLLEGPRLAIFARHK